MTAPPRARREVSAGGIVYRMVDGEPLFLLIRDSYDNWGFPKGHLEPGEVAAAAALREVAEETGLAELRLHRALRSIDWYFRFRGRLIHKICHFFLMETGQAATEPQRAEGITACRWARYGEAIALLSYENAREVLEGAHADMADASFASSAVPAIPAMPASLAGAPDAARAGGRGRRPRRRRGRGAGGNGGRGERPAAD